MQRVLPLLGLLVVLTGTLYFFSPWRSLLVAGLAAVTYGRPAAGMAGLFLLVSADVARPTLGGIYVSFSELLLAACLLMWLARLDWSAAGIEWRYLRWSAPFLAVVLLSALANNEWYRVVPHVLRVSELFVALIAASQAFRGERRWFARAVAAAALVYPASGLLQFPSGSGERVFSAFTNPNQFVGYLNLLVPLTLVAALTSAGWKRWGWGGLLALIFAAQLATQSRAGVGAALLGSALICLLYYRGRSRGSNGERAGAPQRTPRRKLALAAIGSAAVVLLLLAAPVVGRLEEGVVDSFQRVRLPFFHVGFEMWKDAPLLGIGPGNYSDVLQTRYWDEVQSYRGRLSTFQSFERNVKIHVHNLYLQLAVEYGLLGLAAFLWALWCFGRRLWRSHRHDPWALAGVGLLASFAAHNLLDVTFPSLGIETGLALGAILAVGRASVPVVSGMEGSGAEGQSHGSPA